MDTTDQGSASTRQELGLIDAQEPGAPQRMLRRSREDRVVAGLCGGLGRYLGIDPVLLRVAFAVLALFGGSGLLLYIIGAIVIPSEEPGDSIAPAAPVSNAPAVVIGGVLILVGSLLLVNRFLPGFADLIGPLVLVALGGLIIAGARR